MNIINVLLESLKLLKRKPQLFAPKLVSATISSAWALVLLDMFRSGTFQELTSFYLLTTPIIMLLGVFVPLMTADMIKNKDRKGLLRLSFIETVRNWRKILGMTFLTLLTAFVSAVPAMIGFMALYISSQPLFAAIGIATSLLLILAIGFLIYFLPISILTEKTVLSGLKESVKTSIENRWDVSLLMVFSFGMFGLAAVSQGFLETFGQVSFVIGRLISATVTTYTFVISPNFYLKEKENTDEEK